MIEADERLTLTVREAAQRIGVSEPTLRQGIREGKIPVLRLSRRVLIPRVAFERLFDVVPNGAGRTPP